MNYWFTSDTHFGHSRIIKYCNRPFKNCDHMNQSLISNWNARVKKNDVVFVIGDFCHLHSKSGDFVNQHNIRAYKWEEQLNGKIIFIKGNHDKNNSTKTIIERLVIGYGGHRINLVHKPIHADFKYSINLTGHVHEKWEVKRFEKDSKCTICVNVGVDVNNFRPICFNEILKKLAKFKRNNI